MLNVAFPSLQPESSMARVNFWLPVLLTPARIGLYPLPVLAFLLPLPTPSLNLPRISWCLGLSVCTYLSPSLGLDFEDHVLEADKKGRGG